MLDEPIVQVILLNLSPLSEQIGGIGWGIANSMDPVLVFTISLTINCLLFFPIYFGLKLFYKRFLNRIKLFEKYLERTRTRGKPYIDKYGVFGLAAFISLPTPLTGTYTACVLSWLMDLDWKKSFISIVIGSTIGAVIITLAALGIFSFLRVFL